MISKAHNFIRDKNGISSVSLREIRRFSIFYEFFYGYLKSKKEMNLNLLENNKMDNYENEFYKKLTEIELHIYSIILGVFVCYYLRISDMKERKKLNDLMNQVLRKFYPSFEKKDFLDIPLKEELYIANNIELGNDIAKNRALIDNLFSLFVAINNKVPLFIVGKPGCSKSLSVQLMYKAMQGKSSNNPLFKQFPKIILNSYQGSMISTIQGIQKVFIKARKALDQLSLEDKINNISLIFFDEMDLAEHSSNNPLKVIHSELEFYFNEGDKRFAFVGILNRVLDASKMNCGMVLCIPEPEEDDIKETAFIIGKSYDNHLGYLYKDLYFNLGITYFRYKKYLSENHSDDAKKDFHGNSDFYHLIKNVARNIIEKSKEGIISNKTLLEISILSIDRNFGSFQFNDDKKTTSRQVINNIFSALYPEYFKFKNFEVLKRIKENISDLKSRYLLIISKSSVSTFLLSSILSDLNKNYSLYIGSQFPNDIKSEEYHLKILNKIQIHMKQGNILVLKNLESVYPALYDLFNQNFTEVNNKNYARIAIGSSTNVFCCVNDNFRCIVNVDYKQINDEEPPFLNRFEKQIVSFEYLLDKELLYESNKIYKILNELIIYDKPYFKGINYDLKKIFVNFDLEEIQGIMYQASKTTNKSLLSIIDEVISKIALTLPQDIMICIKFNRFQSKFPDITTKIIKSYNCGKHNNLNGFLKTMSNTLNIIYTFSGYLDIIKINKNINNDRFGNIINNNIFEIKISSIKSENEFERKIDNFFNDKEKRICLIRFNPNEGSFLNYIKCFIENKEKELLSNKNEINKEKIFIFIVHLVRIFDQDSPKEKEETNKKILKESISLTSEYYQIFIDNLNGNIEYSIDEIMLLNKRELLERCLNFDEELINNIYLTTSYMDYKIFSEVYNLNEETYINELINYLSEEWSLRNLINEYLLKEVTYDEDVIKQIFIKKDIVNQSDIDIISIIQRNLSKLYIKLFNVFYYRAEKDHFFSSLLSSYVENKNKICVNDSQVKLETKNITESKNLSEDCNNNELIKIMEVTKKEYLKNLKFNDGLLKFEEKMKKNKITIILGLKLPGLKNYIDSVVQKFKNENLNNYQRNEKTLLIEKSKDYEYIYFSKLKKYNESTLNEILNIDIFNEISKNVNENLFYDLLLEDYYTIFISKNLNIIKRESSKKKNDDKNSSNFNLFKNVLKLLISLMWDKGKEIKLKIKALANTINLTESYSKEILLILQIFYKLNIIIDNLFNKIEKIIKGNNKVVNSNFNEALFYLVVSIFRVIILNLEEYREKAINEFFQILNNNKEIIYQILQININQRLYYEEILSFQILIEIIDFLYINKKNQIEYITKIIQLLPKELTFINKGKDIDIVKELFNLFDFLKEIVGDKENFHKLIALILKNEYQIISHVPSRLKLLKYDLENQNIMHYSYQIIRKEISIDNKPEGMKNNLKNLQRENLIKDLICEINSEYLDEIIINYYEYEINKFFGRISNLKFDLNNECDNNSLFFRTLYQNQNNKIIILFDLSCDILKECLEFLENKFLNKEKKIDNEKLCKLYSITYIKIYLNKLVYFITTNIRLMADIRPLIDVICGYKSNNFRKVIKIYILKLLFNFFQRNWDEFENFNLEKYQIDIFEDLYEYENIVKNKNKIIFLTYCFLPLYSKNDYEKYIKIKIDFENKEKNNFEFLINYFPHYIKEDGIDIFLCLLINKIFSKLGLKNYLEDKPKYTNYLSKCNSVLIDNCKSTNNKKQYNLSKLLMLFFNIENYNSKIISEIGIRYYNNPELLEMILYGFRFCVQTLDYSLETENFYSLFFKDNYLENLKKSYVPGNDYPDIPKLNSLVQIENHVINYPDDNGCYVCSCGFYYSLEPSGFPNENHKFKCPVCQKDIGASNQGMIIRKGHYRIFKDKEQKEEQMSKYGNCDENFPNRTLEQYKKEVIEPILKNYNYGINRTSKNKFLEKDKNIRNMSQITYRLLNFLLYNHLFFAKCLNYIPEEQMKNYLHENMSCLEIMRKDWEFLKEALEVKNITSIQIFINLIFKRLSDLIKHCNLMNNQNDRDEFEKKVEILVSKCIEEYPNFEKKYLECNEANLDLNVYDIRTIVSELIQPTEEIYKHEDYPYLKYFTYTKYRSRDDLIKMLGPEKEYSRKYPVLNQYLKN